MTIDALGANSLHPLMPPNPPPICCSTLVEILFKWTIVSTVLQLDVSLCVYACVQAP